MDSQQCCSQKEQKCQVHLHLVMTADCRCVHQKVRLLCAVLKAAAVILLCHLALASYCCCLDVV